MKITTAHTDTNLVFVATGEDGESQQFVFEREPPASYRESDEDGNAEPDTAYWVSPEQYEAECLAHVEAVA